MGSQEWDFFGDTLHYKSGIHNQPEQHHVRRFSVGEGGEEVFVFSRRYLYRIWYEVGVLFFGYARHVFPADGDNVLPAENVGVETTEAGGDVHTA